MTHEIRPPEGFAETQEWFVAIYAWDYCDSEPLATLINAEPIPPVYRAAVAAIIAGRRKPKSKAAAKQKIPARCHFNIVRDLAADISLREIEKRFANVSADRRRQEPIEVIRYADEAYRARVAQVAQEYGVSAETIENIIRELKNRFSSWPVV